jgi:hypothetical protein
MHRARVDVANSVNGLIARDVRVAVQQILEMLCGDDLLQDERLIAMRHRDSASAQFKIGQIAVTGKADIFRVTSEMLTIKITISPDEGKWQTGQQIKDRLSANVAAMDEEFGAGSPQDRQRRGGLGDSAVRVTKDSDDHPCTQCWGLTLRPSACRRLAVLRGRPAQTALSWRHV